MLSRFTLLSSTSSCLPSPPPPSPSSKPSPPSSSSPSSYPLFSSFIDLPNLPDLIFLLSLVYPNSPHTLLLIQALLPCISVSVNVPSIVFANRTLRISSSLETLLNPLQSHGRHIFHRSLRSFVSPDMAIEEDVQNAMGNLGAKTNMDLTMIVSHKRRGGGTHSEWCRRASGGCHED
ncbi:hypothetical protein BU16DRAFT_380772 [Lophium mytilinum]|uniref:Uncharacterized protein n=1 Tax=Lophium mytilinum TaxID=390894 RepID=A0A6A6QRV9_9PEZI|nr:hypothetical protein BU16DRAFT_380772 [Lophium mytilinum]